LSRILLKRLRIIGRISASPLGTFFYLETSLDDALVDKLTGSTVRQHTFKSLAVKTEDMNTCRDAGDETMDTSSHVSRSSRRSGIPVPSKLSSFRLEFIFALATFAHHNVSTAKTSHIMHTHYFLRNNQGCENGLWIIHRYVILPVHNRALFIRSESMSESNQQQRVTDALLIK